MKNLSKNEFLDWFVGFSEGKSPFIVPALRESTNSNRFEIWQSVEDAQILYNIKTHLGFGRVVHVGASSHPTPKGSGGGLASPLSGPDMAIYIVTKPEHLECLRVIFESRICTRNTYLNYHNFYNLDFPTPKGSGDKTNLILNKPNLMNNWLAGFIDAKGCFRIIIESNNTIKLNFELSHNDSELISQIRDLFPNLKNNILLDVDTARLSFSGKPARDKLREYLKIKPLFSNKRIILIKWGKANILLHDKSPDWKSKIIKLSAGIAKLSKAPN